MGNGLGGYEPASAYDQLGCIWDITVLLYELCESAAAVGAVGDVNVCLYSVPVSVCTCNTGAHFDLSYLSHLLPLLTYTPTAYSYAPHTRCHCPCLSHPPSLIPRSGCAYRVRH